MKLIKVLLITFNVLLMINIAFVQEMSPPNVRARENTKKLTVSSTSSTTTTTLESKSVKENKIDEKMDENDDQEDQEEQEDTQSITTTTQYQLNTTITSSDDNSKDECSPPSINDFPTDWFTQKQRRYGAILFHIIFVAYLFKSIIIVCDEYFMSSIELIGQKLNLDQDVTGATFMAVGSSTPEVFISIVAIFSGGSESSIGSIVGSAIFNILFVVGICGLLINGSAKLSIWPFIRDSVFYCIAILILVLLIKDNQVYWYESLALLIVYVFYLLFMMNNDALKNWAYEKFKILQKETNNILPGGLNLVPHNKTYEFKKSVSRSQSGYNRFNDEEEVYAWGGTMDNLADQTNQTHSYQNSTGGIINPAFKNRMIDNKDLEAINNADYLITSSTRQIDFDTCVIQVMLKNKRYFRPKTRFRMAARRIIDEILWYKRNVMKKNTPNLNNYDLNPMNKENYALFLFDMPNLQEQDGLKNFIKWAIFLPVKILFYFTIPDCRVEKYKQRYFWTFFLSVLWLAVLSYLLIWMVTIIGYTLGISDALMAVTFIAAGTSIPDAYTSVAVVQQGMVDMGVSNIIGSNVFDLLIGLAFPWFIKSILNGGFIKINSNGLGYDAVLLYACVITTVLVINFRKWILDRRSGYVFLSIYAAFLIFSSAIELNIFSMVNPPMCS